MSLADEILDRFPPVYPERVERLRPAHTVGIGAVGWFRPSDVAGTYCRAAHFNGTGTAQDASPGWTPAVVRFSNANGQPDPDGRLQVRGMAVRFLVGQDLTESGVPTGLTSAHMTDLVSMSIPVFMVRSGASMFDFLGAARARRVRRPGWMARIRSLLTMSPLPPQEYSVTESDAMGALAWSQDHPEAQPVIIETSQLRLPTSYARQVYHAVHAFKVTGNDGVQRFVRFSWEPSAGVRTAGPRDPILPPVQAAMAQVPVNRFGAGLDERYLGTELGERLQHGAVRFTLKMQIADAHDDTTDPTRVWPPSRRRIVMGTLDLVALADPPDAVETLAFNPGRLIDGIEPSDDAVLATRIAVYEESYRRRSAAGHCPVAHDELVRRSHT